MRGFIKKRNTVKGVARSKERAYYQIIPCHPGLGFLVTKNGSFAQQKLPPFTYHDHFGHALLHGVLHTASCICIFYLVSCVLVFTLGT